MIYKFLKENPFKGLFKELKKEFDFSYEKKIIPDFKNMQGMINGKNVKITNLNNNALSINISLESALKGGFRITKESFSSQIKKAAGRDDIQTYDPLFDEKLELSSDNEINIIALLGKKTREDILFISMGASKLEITKDGINITVQLSGKTDRKEVKNIIKTALSVSGEISAVKTVKQRLKENILENDNEKVRLNNLHFLIRQYGRNRDMQKFLKRLLEDENSTIQAAAANELKNGGTEHLVKLLKKQHQDKYITNPEIIDYLGEKKCLNALPLFKKIYPAAKSDDIKIRILKAVRKISDPFLNDFLIKEMENDNEDLRDEALKALASCGKREAVEPLLKLNKTVFNPVTKNLIQDAIAKIQSRLGPADMGALSIAEHSEKDGALSISGEDGGLSLTDNKDKNLSQEGGV